MGTRYRPRPTISTSVRLSRPGWRSSPGCILGHTSQVRVRTCGRVRRPPEAAIHLCDGDTDHQTLLAVRVRPRRTAVDGRPAPLSTRGGRGKRKRRRGGGGGGSGDEPLAHGEDGRAVLRSHFMHQWRRGRRWGWSLSLGRRGVLGGEQRRHQTGREESLPQSLA
jgi:hypothetical protein